MCRTSPISNHKFRLLGPFIASSLQSLHQLLQQLTSPQSLQPLAHIAAYMAEHYVEVDANSQGRSTRAFSL